MNFPAKPLSLLVPGKHLLGASWSRIPGLVARTFFLAAWKFNRDSCFDRAATLSFATIISLIPLAVLFFSFAGMLGGGQEIIAYVERKVFPLVAPEFQDNLSLWLNRYISPTAFREGPTGAVNLAAVFGLVLGGLNILITSERTFNHIWNVKSRQSYIHKLTTFWLLLTTSPFMIVASMWIERNLIPQGGLVENVVRQHWMAASLYRFSIPLFIECVAFSLLLFFLPAARVRAAGAAAGGLVAAVLWEIFKKGFYLYVLQAGSVTNFYKHLAIIPLFFIWVYLTWLVILWGVELSYAFQNFESLARTRRPDRERSRYSLTYLGVHILLEVHRAFREGRTPVDLSDIGSGLDAEADFLDQAAAHLVGEGILVEDARWPGSFTLGKDPGRLSVSGVVESLHSREFPSEALEIVCRDPESSPEAPAPGKSGEPSASELFSRGCRAFYSVFEGETLESLWKKSREG